MNIERIVEQMPKLSDEVLVNEMLAFQKWADENGINPIHRPWWLSKHVAEAQCKLLHQKGWRKVPSEGKMAVILEPLVRSIMFDDDVDDEYRIRFAREIDNLAEGLCRRLMEGE